MEFGIKDKVALVAASSKGLGRAVAIELAREGVHLIINGRDETALAQTEKELIALGAQVVALKGDLVNEHDRAALVAAGLDKFGQIDILVTNGGGPPSGKFEDFELGDWRRAYDQLVASTVHLIGMCLPGMKERKWGRILTITSQAIKQPVDNLILSNSIRASLAGLVKTLSNEVGLYNITVNNVLPGYTETDRLRKLMASNPSFAKAKSTIPLERFAQPEEFAAAVVFLASKRASYITGVSLPVDGGWIKNIM